MNAISIKFAVQQTQSTFQDLVIKNPNLPWNFDFLSANIHVTSEFIKQNPDLPWQWNYTSLNISIGTRDESERFVDLMRNAYKEYSNITKAVANKIIEINPDKPWDWNAISCNLNIFIDRTIDINSTVLSNLNFSNLSQNQFGSYTKNLYTNISTKINQTLMFKDELIDRTKTFIQIRHLIGS